jgi:nudix motif 8
LQLVAFVKVVDKADVVTLQPSLHNLYLPHCRRHFEHRPVLPQHVATDLLLMLLLQRSIDAVERALHYFTPSLTSINMNMIKRSASARQIYKRSLGASLCTRCISDVPLQYNKQHQHHQQRMIDCTRRLYPASLTKQRFTTNSTQSASTTLHTTISSPSASKLTPDFLAGVDKLKQLYQQESASTGQFDLMSPTQQATAQKEQTRQQKSTDRQAAVLVLLCQVSNQPSLLFTKRAGHLKSHSAEISFPGGHFDEGSDKTLRGTALRETSEELLPADTGLLDAIEMFGQASWLPSIKGTPVTPYFGVLNHAFEDINAIVAAFPGDPQEVEAVFCVSLQDLLNIESAHELPNNRFGIRMAPVFPTREYGRIWGLTAFIVRPYLHRLLKPVFGLEKQREE